MLETSCSPPSKDAVQAARYVSVEFSGPIGTGNTHLGIISIRGICSYELG